MKPRQVTILNATNISLLAVWLIVQVALYLKHGVIVHLEAEKYISSAHQLLNEGYFNEKYLSFSSYIFFLALLFKIGVGYKGVVLAQLALNLLATVRLFQITQTITGKELSGYFAILLFILCYPIQVWNFTLFSESFFLSVAILFFHGCIHYDFKRWDGRLKIVILLILLLFARPSAILYLPGVFAYFAIKKNWLKKVKPVFLLSGLAVLILVFIAGIYLNRTLFSHFMSYFLSGNIICGVDSGFDSFKGINDLQEFLFNIVLFVKISGIKLLYYFGLIRPFYSPGHNLILVLFYPVYLLSIMGFIRFNKLDIKAFSLVTVLTFTSAIVVTCVVWQGRYIVPILPVFIIFASIGLDNIFQRFQGRMQKGDTVRA